MKNAMDHTVAAAVERLSCGGGTLLLVDSEIVFRSWTELQDLVRRERLTIVPVRLLLVMRKTWEPVYETAALMSEPTGRDVLEVRLWKEVARLQERFHSANASWAWWGRFSSCHTASTSLELLTVLNAFAKAPGLAPCVGKRCDWLEILCTALAESPDTSMEAVRAAIRRRVGRKG